VTATSATAACRARRSASSRRTSWVSAWMIRGGRPDRGGEGGADQASRGVVSLRVVGDPGLEVFPAEQRVGLALGVHGRPGQGQVGIRDMTKAAADRAARDRGH